MEVNSNRKLSKPYHKHTWPSPHSTSIGGKPNVTYNIHYTYTFIHWIFGTTSLHQKHSLYYNNQKRKFWVIFILILTNTNWNERNQIHNQMQFNLISSTHQYFSQGLQTLTRIHPLTSLQSILTNSQIPSYFFIPHII